MSAPLNPIGETVGQYIEKLGFAVVPIPPGTKGPTGEGWNKPGGYFTDADYARQFYVDHPDYNAGVLHAPSRTCVLDLDSQHSRGVLVALGIDLEHYLDERGPKSIGNPAKPAKLWYHVPDGIDLPTYKLVWPHPDGPDPVKGRPRVITIFELRAGAVQDVLPPSIHPDTKRPYTWLQSPFDVPLPVLPEELLDLWLNFKSFEPHLKAACPWAPDEVRAKPVRSPPKKFNSGSGDAHNIINAFNAAHEVTAILESHRYRRKGKRRFLAPDSTTKLGGVVLLDDSHCYSHHGADPLADGHRHDAFDLHRLLDHGGDWGRAFKEAKRELGVDRKPEHDAAPEAGGERARETSETALPRQFNFTDLGNAECMVHRHGLDVRYCHPWKKWLIWDGTRWRTDDTAAAERFAIETVRLFYAEASRTENDDSRKALVDWGRKCESRQKRDAMIDTARVLEGVPILPADLDAAPWLLNCLNGTLNLKTGKLRDHCREDYLTRHLPIAYTPKARCKLWLAFLNRIFDGNEDVIVFVRKAVGYALTGITHEQCVFIPWGSGANGKSTFLRTLQALLGPHAQQAAPELLTVRRWNQHPTEIAELHGARLITAIETGKGRQLNETLIKQMTGDDKLRGRFMRQDFFEFVPQFKLWLATNHRPVIKGTDHAIWRRIRLLPFDITIPKAEQNKNLLEKLKGELPGILAWAVKGCLRWQREGLEPPEKVSTATESYRSEMDVMGRFIAECCVVHQDATAKAGELYRTYVEWCEANGERAESQQTFGTELGERGYEKYKGDGTHKWRGIGVLATKREVLDI